MDLGEIMKQILWGQHFMAVNQWRDFSYVIINILMSCDTVVFSQDLDVPLKLFVDLKVDLEFQCNILHELFHPFEFLNHSECWI